ncbi:DUF4365 domain-containing protein [Sulfuriferula sp.]|uniref:DUF4365 domain-containing protein n=1 Tax=Sulfuriferula sp. TaxID=2025307 RepID=UPI00272F0208|nr:DUF4365 domain-containing protein [Sulfuriferula sp.]MDP2025629.1 DUF4365 domain-containing protein [Sulfuriferula sp.]
MDIGKRKEQFNVAYVCAIAAQAGLNSSTPVVDEDSIDLMLVGRGFTGRVRNPQIQLQLKCSSQNMISGDVIKFPLSKKNYDDLRGDDVVCPRYLVVLLVPEDDEAWVQHHDDFMSLHNKCYWVSIKDLPDSPNLTSVTVDVPLAQRLTTHNLRELLVHASNRVVP